jgi:hypothetical protein
MRKFVLDIFYGLEFWPGITAYSYGVMSKSIIWETATKDIPELLRFCMWVLDVGPVPQDHVDE